MKKLVAILVSAFMLLSMLSVLIRAEGIELLAPNEIEIMPTRDFYVIGTIDRGGKTAKEMPLNIRINLINPQGETIRSLESSVGSDGETPSVYFMTMYEYGYSENEDGGRYIYTFTPPDIMYDSNSRESVQNSYNKIIVKDDYFAAVIYGGATQDFDLKYMDKYDRGLKDITAGEYELVIVALDLFGEEVYRIKEKIIIGDKSSRLISSVDLSEYANEKEMSFSNSIVGYWDIGSVKPLKTNGFKYYIPERLKLNSNEEYGKSKNISILLNDIDLNNQKMNSALGTAFSEESKANLSYLYFDIGEESVKFDFAGETFTKEAEVIESKYNQFIKICRAEAGLNDKKSVDFNMNDGIIMNGNITLYGVFSPINPVSVEDGNVYKIANSVKNIKAELLDKDGKSLLTEIFVPKFVKGGGENKSEFEFVFDIKADYIMLYKTNLELIVSALNEKGEVLCEAEPIAVRVIPEGDFIGEYDETYWGKVFCDTVNAYGEAPSAVPLNPDKHITRGNFAAMVNRLLGYSVMGESKFADLKEKSVFYNDCITAKEIGYMTGDEKGNVNADSLITREEAMIILARISDAKKSDKEIVFKDSELISFWAKDYVDALCAAGIVSGYDGYINPHKNITVAEAAALIIKTVKWMYSDEEVLPVGIGNNFDYIEKVADFSKLEITEVEFIDGLTEESIIAFFSENSSAFAAVADYFTENFAEGVYIGKVGNGLEVRDYKRGNIIQLSPEATKLIEAMSAHFVSFSIRYNTIKSNDIYFALGKTAENKEFGIVNTEKDEIEGRKLTPVAENWFYYIQK